MHTDVLGIVSMNGFQQSAGEHVIPEKKHVQNVPGTT
jgi:hypothetical protein